ncbi:hypothetical protein JYU34_016227 [Plutella xylostella]|uniref:Uncharacterized protein n=1 Tax=Plutella xylostella TaxID=51655 RepID=A0ABQ7Q249_PLUXY|nr:hypothetical protein JYU34_016227 [Plutella xylostella]
MYNRYEFTPVMVSIDTAPAGAGSDPAPKLVGPRSHIDITMDHGNTVERKSSNGCVNKSLDSSYWVRVNEWCGSECGVAAGPWQPTVAPELTRSALLTLRN